MFANFILVVIVIAIALNYHNKPQHMEHQPSPFSKPFQTVSEPVSSSQNYLQGGENPEGVEKQEMYENRILPEPFWDTPKLPKFTPAPKVDRKQQLLQDVQKFQQLLAALVARAKKNQSVKKMLKNRLSKTLKKLEEMPDSVDPTEKETTCENIAFVSVATKTCRKREKVDGTLTREHDEKQRKMKTDKFICTAVNRESVFRPKNDYTEVQQCPKQ